MSSNSEKVKVNNNQQLQDLIYRFHNGPTFTAAFEFKTNELWTEFLAAIGLTVEDFSEKHYYFDRAKDIHISESEEGYVWISTMGLIAKSRVTRNQYLNACSWQKITLSHLLTDAILLSEDDNTYDIDSYNYSMVEDLTPALFHNTIFYLETFAKAYLSIYEQNFQRTHKLFDLLILVKKTMFMQNHNNTLFHAYVISLFEGVVNHISSIPEKFKEQFVKYDDNPHDTTVINFNTRLLKEFRDIVNISYDMVVEMYFNPQTSMYLQGNLYQRMIDGCKNADERARIKNTYSYLLDQLPTD